MGSTGPKVDVKLCCSCIKTDRRSAGDGESAAEFASRSLRLPNRSLCACRALRIEFPKLTKPPRLRVERQSHVHRSALIRKTTTQSQPFYRCGPQYGIVCCVIKYHAWKQHLAQISQRLWSCEVQYKNANVWACQGLVGLAESGRKGPACAGCTSHCPGQTGVISSRSSLDCKLYNFEEMGNS